MIGGYEPSEMIAFTCARLLAPVSTVLVLPGLGVAGSLLAKRFFAPALVSFFEGGLHDQALTGGVNLHAEDVYSPDQGLGMTTLERFALARGGYLECLVVDAGLSGCCHRLQTLWPGFSQRLVLSFLDGRKTADFEKWRPEGLRRRGEVAGDRIVTDKAVFGWDPESGRLLLQEMSPRSSIEEIRELTTTDLVVPSQPAGMKEPEEMQLEYLRRWFSA